MGYNLQTADHRRLFRLETTPMQQSLLFQPLSLGSRETRNRIIFGSHTTNFARNNLLSQQPADYYAARAEGGAGILVIEEHIVHPSDVPYERALLGYLPGTSQTIASVIERIHAHNSLALVQLNHNGQCKEERMALSYKSVIPRCYANFSRL